MTIHATLPWRGHVRRVVEMALEEDLGRGDVTTDATVPPQTRGEAVMIARVPLVACGLQLAHEVYAQVDPEVQLFERAKDGERLEKGAQLLHVSGSAASILKGERVALNFVQRMSGVASLARRFVDAVPDGAHTRIVDTRKTTPGLRALERYAVRCGGAHNHREDLSAAVLIKDNHVAAAGGITLAIERARFHAPHTCRIECEVDGLEQLQAALQAGADVVMLDNFDDPTVAQAVKLVNKRAVIEVSGGVTLERIPALAALGVDVISVGALTHSAPAADIGLDWVRKA